MSGRYEYRGAPDRDCDENRPRRQPSKHRAEVLNIESMSAQADRLVAAGGKWNYAEAERLRLIVALARPCSTCNSGMGEHCTTPTETGRRKVQWVHIAREGRDNK